MNALMAALAKRQTPYTRSVVMGSKRATKGNTRDPMRAAADTVLSAVARCVVGNRSRRLELNWGLFSMHGTFSKPLIHFTHSFCSFDKRL